MRRPCCVLVSAEAEVNFSSLDRVSSHLITGLSGQLNMLLSSGQANVCLFSCLCCNMQQTHTHSHAGGWESISISERASPCFWYEEVVGLLRNFVPDYLVLFFSWKLFMANALLNLRECTMNAECREQSLRTNIKLYNILHEYIIYFQVNK